MPVLQVVEIVGREEMKVLPSKEVEERFGITEDQLDQWERDATEGIYHGEPSGPVVVGPGRPMKFGEEMRQVGFKEPVNRVALIDARAAQLGVKRSTISAVLSRAISRQRGSSRIRLKKVARRLLACAERQPAYSAPWRKPSFMARCRYSLRFSMLPAFSYCRAMKYSMRPRVGPLTLSSTASSSPMWFDFLRITMS